MLKSANARMVPFVQIIGSSTANFVMNESFARYAGNTFTKAQYARNAAVIVAPNAGL